MALGDLLHTLDPDRLPDHGGDATTINVIITLEDLKRDLAVAGLGFDPDGDDLHLTADHARRLACQAHLIPIV
ncbi:hypothetical protein, partial [Brevundimonas sp.]|uniref:hypothetical protein n=1 Tax=Brevundimonas sp. TaxID=1871086 RepID=UPI00391C301B